MISAEKQIETINNVINSTKENLKPLSINLIFLGNIRERIELFSLCLSFFS